MYFTIRRGKNLLSTFLSQTLDLFSFVLFFLMGQYALTNKLNFKQLTKKIKEIETLKKVLMLIHICILGLIAAAL